MPTPAAPREGVFAALWIPTDARGRLMKRALAAHLAFLRASGVHGVLALGSTGEFVRMNLAQRQEVLASVAELAAPMTVLANITSIRLDEVIALGKFARRIGLPGVAVMPPIFFPVSQADMLEFFLRAAALRSPFHGFLTVVFGTATALVVGLLVTAALKPPARSPTRPAPDFHFREFPADAPTAPSLQPN